ncbi:Glutathione S-transferase 1, isoform D [Dufourea novaeangliae]|uniref:Glutathione S-transferase 1, isoform D n=1 Tax=Dufourea novaeangliae TaxID=178035 RepID=A0A154NXN7_DUFNO|nr:Glutathione S-transferase 1, isoform D [Dufourea novaeangliae]
MSKVTLYSHDISPPCRSVLLVAHVIDLPLNIHEINLTNHDQTKDEFVKRPIFREGVKSVSEKTMNEVKNAYASLNTLLEGKKWLVGDSYTIADISCVVTATGGIALLNLDNYPNVKDWVQRCEAEIPGYQEINMPGLNKLQEILRSKLG